MLRFNQVPLLQISSLVASRGEASAAASGGAAVQRVGAAVCCAVERFVAVGETIADDNPDVRHSMVLACKEARAAGQSSAELKKKFFSLPNQSVSITI